MTHTSLSAPTPLLVPIRVHIHRAVTNVWLTPNPLTVRKGASGMRFTVPAEFDDGVIGDITNWSPKGPALRSATKAGGLTILRLSEVC